MTHEEIAASVLACLGGKSNVQANALCMTRLRITIINPDIVDYSGLNDISGVLGTLKHGPYGIEVVCRPTLVQGIFDSFARLTGLKNEFEMTCTQDGAEGALPAQPDEQTLTASSKDASKVSLEHAAPLRVAEDISQTRFMQHESQTRFDPHHVHKMTSEAEELTRMLLENDKKKSLNRIHTAQERRNRLSKGIHTSHSEDMRTQKASAQASSVRVPSQTLLHKILILNGPNINMLGIREPAIYGQDSYAKLLNLCRSCAREEGFEECVCYQSNHEGDLVDAIQQAFRLYQGIVFNPGAYTHTSIALLDALEAVRIPTVEVHISKVSEREDFRQVSYVRAACVKTIIGHGIEGYAEAIRFLATYIKDQHHQSAKDA